MTRTDCNQDSHTRRGVAREVGSLVEYLQSLLSKQRQVIASYSNNDLLFCYDALFIIPLETHDDDGITSD